MAKHRVFLILTALELAALSSFIVHCRLAVARAEAGSLPARLELATALELTDLAIWTEARYTRHPSQADRFTPFQDFPASLEHFPAGSIVAVPPRLSGP